MYVDPCSVTSRQHVVTRTRIVVATNLNLRQSEPEQQERLEVIIERKPVASTHQLSIVGRPKGRSGRESANQAKVHSTVDSTAMTQAMTIQYVSQISIAGA